MPISKPGDGENKSDFMSRCMSEMSGEYKDHEQCVAICMSQWSRKENLLVTRNYRQDFKVKINDTALVEVDAGQVKEILQDGRKTLVAPVVAIVEGVLTEWLVPADAIQSSV